MTIDLDLGDRKSHVCVLDATGAVVEESRIATRPKALRVRFEGVALTRITHELHRRVADQIPDELKPALQPLLDALAVIAEHILVFGREIQRLSMKEDPETALLEQVGGVGPTPCLQQDDQRPPHLGGVVGDDFHSTERGHDWNLFLER